MGDGAEGKLDALYEMNKDALEANRQAIEEARLHAKTTEIRFSHIEKDLHSLRELHEDDMEKNSTAHKDFYREIGSMKERLVDVAARNGFIERRGSAGIEGGEGAVENVLGKHALKGWAIIVSALLAGLGVKVLDILSKNFSK